ncbi:glycosyltransferase [Faecalibacter sp. LW9]|uniref:glycosyltransferase n=1 Tax=Faecalibacter sp. LW9 TaxID=3103144 RepID=UPI002AFED76E|nr:glycosyltransferase [Faecalibacter sp. LW9]
MKNKILVIFPIKGPLNGVKVITKNLLHHWENKIDYNLIDTAQAKDFNDFGKFSIQKVFVVLHLIWKVILNYSHQKAYINLSVKGFSFYRDITLITFLLMFRVKVTAHIHANGLEHVKFNLFKKIINKTHLIVINDYQYHHLKEYKNIHVVYNSLPDYYHSKPLVKKQNEKLRILYFSNLSLSKGTQKLQDFIEEINPIGDQVEIKICGGILDSESLEICKNIQKYNFVEILDPIFDEDQKMSLFKDSDVFLFLSDENYEVFPLVYLEALMNGLVIMTTKQVVSDLMISNGNGIEYKIKNRPFIETLLKGNKLKEMQEKSRNVFLKISDFEKFSTQIIKIINDK